MDKIFVPPIKIQGIKTKLVTLIKDNVILNENTLWVEPFMGSGVVGFNIKPKNAVFADINPHLINFYNAIKFGKISSEIAQKFLTEQGKILSDNGESYYYEVRERFNVFHNPLDFLFLNRSCFNGMIRFNGKGNFNVPYCHKAQRFSKAYVTKIVNQIKYVEKCLSDFNWIFICQDFTETVNQFSMSDNVFIYCDPPYIGRHTDYYDNWDESNEFTLCRILNNSNKNFMVSTWFKNKFRENPYVNKFWYFCSQKTQEHFYHVGAKEVNRNSMTELILMNY